MASEIYFDRYAYPEVLFPRFHPPENTKIVVTLPSFNETKTHEAVQSLMSCNPPEGQVILLVLVNEPEGAPREVAEANRKTYEAIRALLTPTWMTIKVTHLKLSIKHAGVGLARKMAMDEAARWYKKINYDGPIVCFDADCTCEQNFLSTIEDSFTKGAINSAVTFFEHPLENPEIIDYELYLRYYIDGLRYAQFPFAYQTLGSCISVRSSTYQSVGGMNRKQAGEDFYFLNQVIPRGQFQEINHTTVFPAARLSDRVPFGTGSALRKIKAEGTYKIENPGIFDDLRDFFLRVPLLFEGETGSIPESIEHFHLETGFHQALKKILNHSRTFAAFQKHFWRWWDAFRILKYMHFATKNRPKVELSEGLIEMDSRFWQLSLDGKTRKKQLELLRKFDRDWKPGILK